MLVYLYIFLLLQYSYIYSIKLPALQSCATLGRFVL
jgi:hypothetical protein